MFLLYIGVVTFNIDQQSIKDVADINIQTGALFVLGMGVTILVISAIGFFGACFNSSCLLNFYGVLMFVFMAVNCAMLYTGRNYSDKILAELDRGIPNAIAKFREDQKLAYGLQNIQKVFKCCGWTGPKDYEAFHGDVPASCCKQRFSLNDAQRMCSKDDLQLTAGCKSSPVLENFFLSALATIMIQIIIVLGSCCLARDIRQSEKY